MKNYNVPVRFNKFLSIEPQYSREWFIDKIGSDEITRLDVEEKNIQLTTGAAFKVMLWPPAIKFSDRVAKILSEQHRIVNLDKDIMIDNFDNFVDEIYLRDGIAKWKIERKKHYFEKHEPKVTIFSITVNEPDYVKNSSTGSYLSRTMAKLKKEIRDELRKEIPNYFSDIVCHSSDNPQKVERSIL